MKETTNPYRIVVGVDFSETGDLALEQALELGSARPRSEVHVVHVARLMLPVSELGYVPQSFPTVPPDEILARLRGHVERQNEAFRKKYGDRRPERILCHLRLEVPGEEIAQLASDLEADLVVVGTHGRRGLSRALIGSVAEVVTRLAPCPVLVVRPKRVVKVPEIEPPCPQCLEARKESQGQRLWCEQHNARHGQRHTYFSTDRVSSDSGMPLLFHG